MAQVNGYDQEAMDARENEVCEICKTRPATEWHHCLLHRRKGVDELDRIYNLQHVCHECHEGTANSYRNRRYHWWNQYLKFGNEFLDWWDSLPLKVVCEFSDERERANAST